MQTMLPQKQELIHNLSVCLYHKLSCMQSAYTALYCHLWLRQIVQYYITKKQFAGKKLLNIKCMFLFYLQVLSETFIILNRIQRDIITNIFRPSRPALEPTQHPVKRVYRVFPGGKVRPGRAADHSPPSSAAVMEE